MKTPVEIFDEWLIACELRPRFHPIPAELSLPFDLQRQRFNDRMPMDPRLEQMFPRPDQKLFMWSFAMYILFRMWGLNIDPSDLQGDAHPPTVLRYEMVMAAAHLDIRRVCQELDGTFVEITNIAQQEAERAIVSCAGTPIRPDDVTGTSDDRVTAHLNVLVDHLDNVLTPELKKYAFVELKHF